MTAEIKRTTVDNHQQHMGGEQKIEKEENFGNHRELGQRRLYRVHQEHHLALMNFTMGIITNRQCPCPPWACWVYQKETTTL